MDEFEKKLLELDIDIIPLSTWDPYYTYKAVDIDNVIALYRSMTCKMKWRVMSQKPGQCSECHGFTREYMPNYCPNCGRKVIQDG